jgi:hypothetical protein
MADFSSNKSAPANRKKGFYKNFDPKEVGFFLYEAAQNFEVVSNIQNYEIKKSKTFCR